MSFITLDSITIRIRDKFLFRNTSLQLEKVDNLLVVGANGSGKTTFVKAIAGLLPLSQGEIVLEFLNDPLPYPSVHKNKIAYVSFDAHKKIHLENEFKKDLEELTGKSQKVLNLSTGQLRKYLIDKALKKKPEVLILDEPFDGLDSNSRKDLMESIEALSEKLFLILVTHRSDEVSKKIKKAVFVENGVVEKFGDVKEILDKYKLFESKQRNNNITKRFRTGMGKILIDFREVSVEFEGKKVLSRINWQVKEGENWAILGPNGAGKSTLIKLITGENLQVFANKIKIFGESRNELDIDELNRRMSLVSADLSLRTPDYLLVSKIIGPQGYELIKKLGISNLLEKRYGDLSFGQKRLVLIAGNLAKKPRILILDEPCHGLDSKNRTRVLSEIEIIASNGTMVILITHNEDELIPSITNIMHLKNGKVEKISDLR